MIGHVLGLDLGQAGDYTALSVLEWRLDPVSSQRRYAIRHLERFRRVPYDRIVTAMAGSLDLPPLKGTGSVMVVDSTGVGLAVVDMFRAAGLGTLIEPLVITGGEKAYGPSPDNRTWRVPKRDLAITVQVLLQGGRLKIGPKVPNAEVLVQELQKFKVKISLAGKDTYEAWRDGDHDDLVLSVAMAAWFTEHVSGGRVIRPGDVVLGKTVFGDATEFRW